MSSIKNSPWLRGILDTLIGSQLMLNSEIPTKNRLAVILVDSAFETACRAYLKYKSKIQLDKNHSHRENLIKTIKSNLSGIDEEVWDKINYYYEEIRCDFYHQSAGKTLADIDLQDYKEAVEFIIDNGFQIQISKLVDAEVSSYKTLKDFPPLKENDIDLGNLKEKSDKVLVAVSATTPRDFNEVNDFFKKQGDAIRLKKEEFLNIVARNSGSKKLFFYDKESKKWLLSRLGSFKLNQLAIGGNYE